ncbi:hypothetical protein URH17368_0947 [Alicyclobacillus hesperidum URH17-3-68]|nr:hypothetical protein URH17368_0947 [Alicyclobacillus hesperidum URH17-3-68]
MSEIVPVVWRMEAANMFEGDIRELDPQVGEPVTYRLSLSSGTIELASWFNKTVRVNFTGVRRCIVCGRKVNKLFQNGYCFPCVRSLAECDLCIVKPHDCHFHLGTCRDETFAEEHCMVPHYVYLAWSSGYKVGLTRKGRQFKRWMDQGATLALPIAEVPTRKLAGELEMEIAKHLPDKTDWRKMLKEEQRPEQSLAELRQEVVARLTPEFSQYVLSDVTTYAFRYPRPEGFNVNIKSVQLDKQPIWEGTLRGAKGQYLLFDEGVWNVKKFAGYEVSITCL